MRTLWWFIAAVLVTLSAGPASALPSFARKHGTSCQTCHTVYPKLTPFGEAFRRNGFRFPGTDSDYVKQETIAMTGKGEGGEQSTISAIPPLAFGFNGQALVHPDKNSTAATGDNHVMFSLRDLIAEGHLWAGGAFDDKTTYFGEATFSSAGNVDVEHAQLFLNDLLGPKHAVNIRVGRGFANVSSFAVHSSYVADTRGVSLAVTALQGATSQSWNVLDHYNGLELFGVLGGRFDYTLGLNAGANAAGPLKPTEDFYGHVGYKIGGMQSDGEGAGKADNPARPWEETSLTFEAFAYHSTTQTSFNTLVPDPNNPQNTIAGTVTQFDRAHAFGGGLRGQLGSLELNSGIYYEDHNHAAADGSSATALAHYDELSYMVSSWLVPALRFEYFSISPGVPAGSPAGTASPPSAHLYRIIPGIAATLKPNIKCTLIAVLESSNGAPAAGNWSAVGGMALPPAPPQAVPTDPDGSTGLELSAVMINFAFAF
jgi:hypothetical protein